MICNQIILNVSDNSGVKNVICFKIFKYSSRNVGAFIYLVVKSVKNTGKLKQGMLVKGILIRTKLKYSRFNGNFFQFETNDAVLIDNKNDFFCTRVFGPLLLDLRRKQKIRVLSMATKLI
jgi:large subunit ribosomal protein L14